MEGDCRVVQERLYQSRADVTFKFRRHQHLSQHLNTYYMNKKYHFKLILMKFACNIYILKIVAFIVLINFKLIQTSNHVI